MRGRRWYCRSPSFPGSKVDKLWSTQDWRNLSLMSFSALDEYTSPSPMEKAQPSRRQLCCRAVGSPSELFIVFYCAPCRRKQWVCSSFSGQAVSGCGPPNWELKWHIISPFHKTRSVITSIPSQTGKWALSILWLQCSLGKIYLLVASGLGLAIKVSLHFNSCSLCSLLQ